MLVREIIVIRFVMRFVLRFLTRFVIRFDTRSLWSGVGSSAAEFRSLLLHQALEGSTLTECLRLNV